MGEAVAERIGVVHDLYARSATWATRRWALKAACWAIAALGVAHPVLHVIEGGALDAALIYLNGWAASIAPMIGGDDG